MKPQVKKEQYFKEKYDDLRRFVSYFYQVDLTRSFKSKKILEVGIGNGTVSNYLKQQGYDITTFDFDKTLNPDYVGDILDLSKTFKPDSFDVIICCEVLEHLPFEKFQKCLTELRLVARKGIVLSLPNSSIKAAFSFKIPYVKRKGFVLLLPLPFKHKFDGEHYWEIGKRGYSSKKIRKIIKEYFKIEKEFIPSLNSYHRFYLLIK